MSDASAFTIHISGPILDDLKRRLAGTRWGEEPSSASWGSGTSPAYLRELMEAWRTEYDWCANETRLNTLPHFRGDIKGVALHFVHLRSANPDATPLLLLHGWPDSFCRFIKVVPLLTRVFHLVIPSLPGFGFSERVAKSADSTAQIMHALMTQLGYKRYAVAGGDLGSPIACALAVEHPAALSGIHLTEVAYPTGDEDPESLSNAEKHYVASIKKWLFTQGAYLMVHGTKPASLTPALSDSPAGLASWILSFIDTGAEHNRVEDAFGGRDELLTNLTIYWATQTIGTSMQTYRENAKAVYTTIGGPKSAKKSDVPASIAVFPRTEQFPREWAERFVNVQRFTKMPRGGHFAALEEPELYANDVLESLGSVSLTR
jgi:pimeloyl-ACP methyl ester carboxylesterase